jgi:tRNA dimethylallyltransferase
VSCGDSAGMRPRLIAIIGPTAAGKSDLAVELAQRHEGEIVSVDSRQIYKRLDIGTAKASPAMRAAVPHHLLDVVEPDERYDAARFAREATQAIEKIRGHGGLPVLCGGSGLYLQALTEGIVPLPPPDDALRSSLHAEAERRGAEEMHAELGRVDPAVAERIVAADRLRILRALEVYRQTGRPLGEWQAEHGFRERPFELLTVMLSPPVEELDARICHRATVMWEGGLLEETRSVLDAGFDGALSALQAIGYREAQLFFAGGLTAVEAIDAIALATRRYAKRQRTWFRRFTEAAVLETPEIDAALAARITDFAAGD